MPAPSQRPYQIVVWGANGFTGSLVCEHIATAYTGDVRWALAGRNRAKLERLRDRLSNINPACKDVPIVVVDMADRKSVDRMVKQTDVIVATAGPFSRVGTAVVESSVRQGTHYCDITGETLWVRKMIGQFHHQAEARKVKIVHCCGFDSIPSDLGTLMVVDHMRQKLHRSCGRLEVLFGQCKGGVSGGSIATTLDEFSAPYSEEEMASLHDPYCLDPPSSRRGPDIQDYWGVAYNPYAKSWTFPHCWSRVNSRIVRRSNALQDHRYGKHFRYREAAEAEGPVDALLGTLAVSFVHFLTAFHPARELVRALLPKPGEGPPPEFQQNGYWSVRLLGFTTESDPGRKPSRVEAVVGGRRDPGYWETSRMLLESGLCLALDSEELQQQEDLRPGGVLTPATAMGHVLIRRLRRSGMSFEIKSPDPPTPPANAAPSARPDRAGLDRSAAAAAPAPSAPTPSPPAPDARPAGRAAAGKGAGLARPPPAIARLARFRLCCER